jgi:hypothetical protein
MSGQIPIPTFDDIRKLLNFWFDQEEKWFYFEIAAIQAESVSLKVVPGQTTNLTHIFEDTNEYIRYAQTRIVGKIHDVVEYPPSLLLQDVSVFTVIFDIKSKGVNLISSEKRNNYGLVFSQIIYYEPIEDPGSFLNKDVRVSVSGKKHLRLKRPITT